jgi:phosphoadenosine phosphosulfate reductase
MITSQEIQDYNTQHRHSSPQEIIRFAIANADRPIITTNFGPTSASLLHALTCIKKDVPVLWGDSGYNTPETYLFSQKLQEQLELNLHIFTPQRTKAYLDVRFSAGLEDPLTLTAFTDIVKIEPLQRAFAIHQPDVWFTNIRKSQTRWREGLDIFSRSQNGLLKVSPFFYFSEEEIDNYLQRHNLPKEAAYFDPTKPNQGQECGLHLAAI